MRLASASDGDDLRNLLNHVLRCFGYELVKISKLKG